ncbi:MAG: type IV pilus assembly protein PilQ [Halieaceae bacterium]|jgi:type IV pilus assembly protein PilQ
MMRLVMGMKIYRWSKGRRRLPIVQSAHAAMGSVLFFVCCLCTQLAAANALTGIDFSSKPQSKFEIRLEFEDTPPDPKTYTIESPARISMDFVGVSSSLDRKKYPLPFGNATGVVVLEAGDRTRMIINLVELLPYKTRVVGNTMFIEVGNEGAGDYLKRVPESFQQADPEERARVASISDFDFQRGEEGEARLVLTLADPDKDVNVFSEGETIHVEFVEGSISQELQRRYDVTDFATPVTAVEILNTTKGVTLSLETVGNYDYLAYQTDDTYVVSVKPQTERDIEQRRAEFTYVGDRLSLNFQDIEVRAVLQLIADFTSLNLVASDSVVGRITLRLQNVPWDQALDLVLKARGLDKRQVGNVLMIGPASEIAERERLEIESNKQVEELSPLQTEFIRIRYASAPVVFALLQGGSSSSRSQIQDGDQGSDDRGTIISSRGSVLVDERTNSLLITDTAKKLADIRAVIELVDVPVRQVVIEARIVIARSDYTHQLGIQWGGGYVNTVDGGDGVIGISGSNDTANGLTQSVIGGSTASVDFPGALLVDLGVSGPTGSIAIGYTSNDLLLSAELAALEAGGVGEIVSQPKVITGDKSKATIKSGTEIPYQQASASGQTTVSFKEAVLGLEVTPNITPDDRIMLELVINQDSVGELVTGENGSQIPTIDTTSLTTSVLVGNGETVVLGGVFRTEDLESTDKVPFLGDLPYVGRLFKRTATTKTKNELLIFITPRILSDELLD